MMSWDSSVVKAQLRLTNQRLGQVLERKESQAHITQTDIATLLRQGNIEIARAKAQRLIQEDVFGDMLEALGMYVGILSGHVDEIERNPSPSPAVVEAASSIIFAAPHTGSKDLNIVRDVLIHRFGPDFARSAIGNLDNHVSRRVVAAVSATPPSAANLNEYLTNIAKVFGVEWSPEFQGQDILNTLSEILDPAACPTVDLPRLRQLSSHGLPEDPPWIRPRIWKLLFGTLPALKSSWDVDILKQRDSYYALIRRLLRPFSSLPPPTVPLAPSDASLLNVAKQLGCVPPELFDGLENEPEGYNVCPLHESSPDEIKIDCVDNLEHRLRLIQDGNNQNSQGTPEIRLESDGSPEISPSTPDSLSDRRGRAPNTLLQSKTYNSVIAHHKHSSALLRLLYVHSCLNPGNSSPHLPSLLIPLYIVLLQEVDPKDLAHVEADTFWLFETMVGEFAELEDDEGGGIWMKKLSERLAWADVELSANLLAKGLDPALPHYSYHWMAPLLTQTLPRSAVFLVWDTLFSCPMRTRDSNPKLEFLLDVCTSMLIRARNALIRLGKSTLGSPGLWDDENAATSPSSMRSWELGGAFLEGMSLLQRYPLDAAGGIDRILQTASDLAIRRAEMTKGPKSDGLSLGARLKVTMWKGFTNQVSSDSPENEEEGDAGEDSDPDEGNETETPLSTPSDGITSRLASTLWRGITNQSSMDVPPTPIMMQTPSPSTLSHLPSNSPTSSHASDSPLPTPSPQASPSVPGPSKIWGYAEKLRDSDTAATLAKVSSNWKAKALAGSWISGAATKSPSMSPPDQSKQLQNESFSTMDNYPNVESRRASLPSTERNDSYSPPARPAVFRPPRDSMLPQPRRGSSMSSSISSRPSSPETNQSENSLLSKTKNLQASLASFTGIQAPTPQKPKSGPRPLLLNSSTLLSTQQQQHTRSSSNTPAPPQGQWAEVMRMKGHMGHQASQSSISSLSPSDALWRSPFRAGSRSDRDSDSGSRIVPLNRRSVSPMAPIPRNRPASRSSSETNSDGGLLSPPLMPSRRARSSNSLSYTIGNDKGRSDLGWGRIDDPESTISLAPPSFLDKPFSSFQNDGSVNGSNSTNHEIVATDPPSEPPQLTGKLVRKKTPPTKQFHAGRIRTKRSPQRPTSLNIQESSGNAASEQKILSPSSLSVQWPDQQEQASTPKAADFEVDESNPAFASSRTSTRVRKTSGRNQESRIRKVSSDTQERLRKASTGSQTTRRKQRESAGVDGDDEGYDDLLSAYESEEGMKNNIMK